MAVEGVETIVTRSKAVWGGAPPKPQPRPLPKTPGARR